MSDRFDFEQEIMDCWRVTDDLQCLHDAILEKNLDTDEIVNILLGLISLYNLKFDTLFNTFENYIIPEITKRYHKNYYDDHE